MNYFDKVIKYDPVNNYYVFLKEELREIKRNISQENINKLKTELNDIFKYPLMSVTTKEKKYQFTDPHDYVSLATYWWPNEETNKLPYVNKDGFANPEGAKYDKDKFRLLAYITYYAALLYYLTEEQKYQDLFIKHCRHWFINKETAMNPNMDHAQFIPGINNGRGKGIIDFAANFSYALHMLSLLKSEKILDLAFYNDMKDWLNSFKIWLQNSPNGVEEKNALNNHGTMYDFLELTIDLYLENNYNLEKNKNNFMKTRVFPQIDENGILFREITRTKSKSYSLMGAKAIYDYLKLLEDYQIVVNDQKVNAMLKWLYNGLILLDNWPYQQVTIFDEAVKIPLFREYQRKIDKTAKFYCKKENLQFKIPLYLFSLKV